MTYIASSMRIGPQTFVWGERTYIMGVINTSPDSFSGDGLRTAEAAVEQAQRMVDEGADILDVGGQSTRPGANKTQAGFDEITAEEEMRRVVPAIERIRAVLPHTPISVDTYKPEVARAALLAGADMINDIWGFRRDPEIARITADARAPAVVMHNQRAPMLQADGTAYDGVIPNIEAGLQESMRIASAAGLEPSMLIADPGFGFGWSPQHNLEMLRRLGELRPPNGGLSLPLLVGTSRKSTIGAVLGGVPEDERIFGTAASVALAIAAGADIIRVHDVAVMKQVALVSDAIVRGWRG